MYLPKHFEPPGREALEALMRAHPLATLVRGGDDGLVADPLPLLYDASPGAHGRLRGHVARANPLWREADGRPVLALFHGPQGYVSPSWYPSKQADGRVVPTWNYAIVQARGTLRAVQDPVWLRALVGELTATHEAAQARPWAVEDAPDDFVERMIGAIVGIEVDLDRLAGKWKLSQNRSAADRDGVVAALAGRGDPALAAWVRDPARR